MYVQDTVHEAGPVGMLLGTHPVKTEKVKEITRVIGGDN